METRKRRIMINKAGGNAGKESVNYRISLPAPWLQEMGLNEDERDIKLIYKDGKIIIIKNKEEETMKLKLNVGSHEIIKEIK